MVSIRRRKLLGLCSGRSSFLDPFGMFSHNRNAPGNLFHNTSSLSVHPMPSVSTDQPPLTARMGVSSNLSGSSASDGKYSELVSVREAKRRKRQQRKHFENPEPCLMRGVYFKNMKWQAAIKVEKKQIHLGTVGSQAEAAHLYDRAAYMCGRKPNFELSEEEKQELGQFKWDEFLAMTRRTITNKKQQRRVGGEVVKQPESPLQGRAQEGDDGGAIGMCAEEGVKQDASAS